jgi:hypothetical protein
MNPSNFIYITDFPNGNSRNFGENTINTPRNLEIKAKLEEFNKRVENGEGLTENCYKYTCKDEFVIYDTPGLSDGKGVERDNENIEKILREASTAGHLNAIIYVINSCSTRTDLAIKNSIIRLASIIPSKFEKSVLAVHTFCPSGRTKVNDSWLPFTPRKKFLIDTDLFDYSKEEFKENLDTITQTWEKCKSVLMEIQNEINIMNAECVQEYEFLFKEHNQAKACYAELKLDLKTLIKLRKVLKQNEKLCSDYSNFCEDQEILITQMILTEYHNTLCMLCNSICHERCRLDLIAEKGSIMFNNCACMNQFKICKVCNCDHQQHYHDHKLPIKLNKTIKSLVEELPIMYEADTMLQDLKINQHDLVKIEIQRMRVNIQKVENEIKRKMSDIVTSAVMIKKICPKFSMRMQIDLEIDFIKKRISIFENVGSEEYEEQREWKDMLENLHQMMVERFPREISID